MTAAAAPVAHETEILSRALDAVLTEQHGPELAERVRWIHRNAAELRDGDEGARAALMDFLHGLADAEVEPYIRACSLQLQLANIAEERERIRRRREYDASGDLQRESLAESAELLEREGVNAGEALRALRLELVLTAHPTEATRRSVLDHQADLMDLLDRLDDPRCGAAQCSARSRRSSRSGGRPTRCAAPGRASTTRCGATCSCSSRRCSTPCPRCTTRSSARSE